MSKRKKAEKKKDFVKQKLKVGKTQKAANHTDTSFKSKSINLPNQAIGTKSIDYYISLTKHHSANTRKEVLVALSKTLPTDSNHNKQLLASVIPLITDDSFEVRTNLLLVFNKLIEERLGLVRLNDKNLILHIHSAMNHISPGVRNFLINFLHLVISRFPDTLINLYFTKTLDCFFNLLCWTKLEANKTANTVSSKNMAKHLDNLRLFLEVSLKEEKSTVAANYHSLTSLYLVPDISNPYNQINLFNAVNSLSTDLISRRRIVREYTPILLFNLQAVKVVESQEVQRLGEAIERLLEAVEVH